MAATEKQDSLSSPSAAEVEDLSRRDEEANLARLDTKGIHEFREDEGYVLDQSSDNDEGGRGPVKLAADGHTRLIPQPSDDPDDPLNWTWRKKHIILFVIAVAAFLPDYGSATGAVTLQLQAE